MSQYSKFYLGTGAAPIEHISVGGGTVDPDGTGTITITNGANITWTAGVSTMQADVTGTTDHAVQVGNATGSLTSLGLGLNNQFLRGNTGADPSWNAVDLTTDVTGILPVGSGGTGVSSVTAHNLLVGDGTNALNEITAGTNGQFLLGVTGADAVFATPTNGNNISWTLGAGTTRADVTGTTQYTVQVGNATGSLTSLATGTATQVLQSGGAAANPAWSTATYPATTTQGDVIYSSADNTIVGLAKNASATRYIANTGASNNPAWDQVNLANGVTGTLPATNGGTGLATATIGDVLYASAANTYSNLAFDNTATRYLANTGGGATVPAWDQVSLTNGVTGTLPVTSGGRILWTNVTATPQAMAVNSAYIANNAGGNVAFTLPATAAVGDVIYVAGAQNGWSIAQNAGQTIHFLGSDTTTGVGGSLASTTRYDSIELVCITANTDFVVTNVVGNITVV